MKTISTTVLVAAALLAGCGGGSDDTPPAASDAVPDSASASIAGMTAWLTALRREDAQTREPVDADRFQPPAPEDGEPQALTD